MREDWVKYQSLFKEAKSAVNKAKFNRYKELYEKLEKKQFINWLRL